MLYSFEHIKVAPTSRGSVLVSAVGPYGFRQIAVPAEKFEKAQNFAVQWDTMVEYLIAQVRDSDEFRAVEETLKVFQSA